MTCIPSGENPLLYEQNNQQDFLTDTLQRQEKAQDLPIDNLEDALEKTQTFMCSQCSLSI